MKLDAATARILLSLFVAFHNIDAGTALPADARASLVLTEAEADRGLAIIESEFDCDIAAVGRALASSEEISGALRELAAAGAA